MADTQITELEGQRYLISQLLADGVEVANPLRDHGIDLIAYLDQREASGQFLACPIQLKTATDERFILHNKYEKFPNLLMVYAWNISDDKARVFYALTYEQAKKLLQRGPGGKDHTKAPCWTKENGSYHFRVSTKWRAMLEPYLIKPDQWKDKIREVSKLNASSNGIIAAVKE